MTWTGWNKLGEIAADYAVAYVRSDGILTAYIQAMDDLLSAKNATDAALIFENEKGADIVNLGFFNLGLSKFSFAFL